MGTSSHVVASVCNPTLTANYNSWFILTLIGEGFEFLRPQLGLVAGDSEGGIAVRAPDVDLAPLCHYSIFTWSDKTLILSASELFL